MASARPVDEHALEGTKNHAGKQDLNTKTGNGESGLQTTQLRGTSEGVWMSELIYSRPLEDESFVVLGSNVEAFRLGDNKKFATVS